MAADVGGGGGGKKKGKKGRSKKGNPRIDMTPMVDLGFLLLTFFVLTTTMSTPTTLPVIVPDTEDKKKPDEIIDKIAEGKVLNLLVGGKNRVFYYQGIENVELNMTTYSDKGLRPVIVDYQNKVAKNFGTDKDPKPLVVMIKMTKDATFKNWVDLIDEMNITEQRRYMLLDITPEETDFIKGYEESQKLESSIPETIKIIGTVPKETPKKL